MPDHRSRHDDDLPRVERWLVVAASSLVPLAAAVFVAPTMQIALWIAGGALLATGLAMGAVRGPRRAPAIDASVDRADRRSEVV